MLDDNRNIERLAIHEERLNNYGNRLERLETNTETLHEMKVLLELQTNMNKEQNIQMRSFEETLSNVNNNLTRLNTASDQLKVEVGSFGERVSKIEESNERGKINISELTVKIFISLAMIIPTAITAWVLIQLGLR